MDGNIKEAGKRYPENEKSFRQTIHGSNYSDRGFKVVVDRRERKILISFDSSKVDQKHSIWLKNVQNNIGLKELAPQPYWGFDDLASKARTKLLNCFYVQADVKKEASQEFYKYSKVQMLQNFNFNSFLKGIETGDVLVDFDARTGHNHGTKFRLRQNFLPALYSTITVILE